MTHDTVLTYSAAGNTVTFAPDSPFWLTEIKGASGLDIAVSETQSTGQIGGTVTSQSIQPRDITLNGAIMSDVEQNRAGLLRCIVPDVTGRLSVFQNGGAYFLDGCPKSTPEIQDGSVIQNFQFVLHCAYPYWRSAETNRQQIAGLTALFHFPFRLANTWKISDYTASLFSVVTNHGSAPIEFDAIFTARTEVDSPELYHMETGAFLRINQVMTAGECITISTVYGRKGVRYTKADGTQENGFRFLDVDSDLNLRLSPGENTFRTAARSNREGLQVEISAPKGVVFGV